MMTVIKQIGPSKQKLKLFSWNKNLIKSGLNLILVSLPRPLKLKYYWNFGSILLVLLSVQLITGIFLALKYVGDSNFAFFYVDLVARDIWRGWLIRSIHSKGASFFFSYVCIFIYLVGFVMALSSIMWLEFLEILF